MEELRVDGVQCTDGGIASHKDRASSSVVSVGMTENMSREHASRLVER